MFLLSSEDNEIPSYGYSYYKYMEIAVYSRVCQQGQGEEEEGFKKGTALEREFIVLAI